MYMETIFPPPDVRLARALRALEGLDRECLAAAAQFAVDRLDVIDGDPDFEDDDPDRCEAGDDGLAPFVRPWDGAIVWGSDVDMGEAS